MQIVVLAKAVPALDGLEFDPATRTVRREAVPLFLNPFDQRALRVALELRRTGETVTVVSLGPPTARGVLRETRAVGADRAILISDPALAGSDTLATATALAAAVRRLGAELVLAGAWTTDSETGQVGPEVAALLDWPVLTGARSIRRTEGSLSFDVVVDTARGWAAHRGSAPVVLAVGEKIAKPLRPEPDAVERLGEASVERWGLSDLGLEPNRVGLAGSATFVESVAEAAPSRTPQVFDRGAVADRVEAAVAAIGRRLRVPVASPGELPPGPSARDPGGERIVLVTDASGRLEPGSLPILARLRRQVPDGWSSALWIGADPTEEETVLLERAGALGGYLVRARRAVIAAASAASVVEHVAGERPAISAIVLVADPFGREVAGRFAARARLGLVGDAIDARVDAHGGWHWSKPSFGGRTVAEIGTRTRPSLATVRPGAAELPEPSGGGGFGWTEVSAPVSAAAWERYDAGIEAPAAGDLDARDVVVAVGMGLGGPDAIARLAPTLARWNAALAATRRVVDAGWVPRQLQVGLTGRMLAPRLAVLLGISGSSNHVVGWRRAGTILAVNREPDAPVFREADVGIVGSVEEVLPLLDGALARVLGG